MTYREQLREDGYVVFPTVIPEDLSAQMVAVMDENPAECFTMQNPPAASYTHWLMEFICKVDLGLERPAAEVTVFNRPVGTGMYWHDDSPGGGPNGRRVFSCAYLTPTTNGCGPLKIIPGSQHGGYPDLRKRLNEVRATLSNQRPWRNVFEEEPDVFHYIPMSGEKILEVPERTLVVADERLIHGVAINKGDRSRAMTLVWLWKCDADFQRDKSEGK